MIRQTLTLSSLVLAGCAAAESTAPRWGTVAGEPVAVAVASGRPDYLGYVILAAAGGVAGYYLGQWQRPQARRYQKPLILRSVAASVDRLASSKRAEKNYLAWRWATRSFIKAGEITATMKGPGGRLRKPLSGRAMAEITGLSLRQQKKFIDLLRLGARDPNNPDKHFPVIRVRASDGAEWLMNTGQRRVACDYLEYDLRIRPPRFKLADRDIWFGSE